MLQNSATSTGAKGLKRGVVTACSLTAAAPDFGAFPKIGSGIGDLESGGQLDCGVAIFLFFSGEQISVSKWQVPLSMASAVSAAGAV